MHLAPVLLILISLTTAHAGMFEEHLRLIAHPGPGAGCSSGLQIRGLMPNGHGEDQLHEGDALSTVLIADLLHMNRLFHVIERIQFSLNHADPLRRMDPERTGHTPKKMIRSNLIGYEKQYGSDYIGAAFGHELLGILENDNDHADTTWQLLVKQKEVLRRLAYAVKYHYAWRLVFMEMHPDLIKRGNRSFGQCMTEWNLTYSPEVIADLLREISAQAETELLKDNSGMFAPKDVARRPLSLENWTTRFPTAHLPEIAIRAITYLQTNLRLGPVGTSAVYLRILDDLSIAVEQYHVLVEAARQTPSTPVRRLENR